MLIFLRTKRDISSAPQENSFLSVLIMSIISFSVTGSIQKSDILLLFFIAVIQGNAIF